MNSSIIKTALYTCNISPLKDAEKFSAVYSKLSADRKLKVDKCRKEDDKLRSAAAGFILTQALSELGIACTDETVCLTEYGKPFLPSYPQLNFNLSHSGDFVLCAISSQSVGCDVERIADVKPEISRRFSQPEHAHVMAQENDAARRELLFRYWTLKESLIKADGRGFALPLDSFEIKLEEKMQLKIGEKMYYLKEFELHPEYRCALCGMADDIYTAELITIDFHI